MILNYIFKIHKINNYDHNFKLKRTNRRKINILIIKERYYECKNCKMNIFICLDIFDKKIDVMNNLFGFKLENIICLYSKDKDKFLTCKQAIMKKACM